MPKGLGIGILCLLLSVAPQAQNRITAEPPNTQVRPASPLDTVRIFYTYIIRHRPIGIPEGADKKVLWPLMSQRLVRQLNTLQACEDDYYRRNGETLRANQFKPTIGWLEQGLFSGWNEAASPSKFIVLNSTKGKNKVDVHLRFTHKQTYCCGHPTAYEHYEGIVTVILEGDRFVIDDYVPLGDDDRPGKPLSKGYEECKGGNWVGLPGDQY
jgi:hypothetical protein